MWGEKVEEGANALVKELCPRCNTTKRGKAAKKFLVCKNCKINVYFSCEPNQGKYNSTESLDNYKCRECLRGITYAPKPITLNKDLQTPSLSEMSQPVYTIHRRKFV